jgi:hypothetical protein
MSLAYKRPALWAPGVIPTVEFLVYGFAGAVKKRASRIEIGVGD